MGTTATPTVRNGTPRVTPSGRTPRGASAEPSASTGIQHPAPTLTCTVNRDEKKLYVTAPYAAAVHNGKNVTADPPRTELWGLLYAQVKQADNKDFRNVLLDDLVLSPQVRVEFEKAVPWKQKYAALERNTLKRAALQTFRDDAIYAGAQDMIKLTDPSTVNSDATKYGTTLWPNDAVTGLLALYGLPPNSPLSVLCVEVLPHITNIYEHVSALRSRKVRDNMRAMVGSSSFPSEEVIAEELATRTVSLKSVDFDRDRPLRDQLGHYRIFRTLPLVKVPYVC